MNTTMKIVVVLALIAAVGIMIAVKQQRKTPVPAPAAATAESATSQTAPAAPAASEKLPRLVDLGADKCIPCKMMAPILEELKETYTGKLDVVFIDVWKNPDAATGYGIKVIPTQIFYDAAGKELFRHEGFYSKEDILAKWQEFGITFESETM